MPYISIEKREELFHRDAENSEELQYLIATMISDYLLDKGRNSSAMNDVMGALSSAKADFYRKVVSPHKDTKELINGHVY